VIVLEVLPAQRQVAEVVQFVHLFDEADANSIRHGGTRVAKAKWRKVTGVEHNAIVRRIA
jgi:hypothetical protein